MSENSNNKQNNDNQELGALWKKESKNGGQKYLAGHIIVEKKVKVVVFANREKKNERYPDFRILKAKEFSGNATEVVKKETVQEVDEDVL